MTTAQRREMERLFKRWDRTTRHGTRREQVHAWNDYVAYGESLGIPAPPNPYPEPAREPHPDPLPSPRKGWQVTPKFTFTEPSDA